MIKDFDNWNKEKKHLESKGNNLPSFHRREIWWCSIGLNLGDEEDGKNELFERPVLIVKKFSRSLAWVVPTSSKVKSGIYYHEIRFQDRSFTLLLSQMRPVSVKRLRRFVRKILPEEFNLIREKIMGLLLSE